jgi:hypothetical protein
MVSITGLDAKIAVCFEQRGCQYGYYLNRSPLSRLITDPARTRDGQARPAKMRTACKGALGLQIEYDALPSRDRQGAVAHRPPPQKPLSNGQTTVVLQ